MAVWVCFNYGVDFDEALCGLIICHVYAITTGRLQMGRSISFSAMRAVCLAMFECDELLSLMGRFVDDACSASLGHADAVILFYAA